MKYQLVKRLWVITLYFASEKISIGENCLIAPFTYIVDSNHEIKKGLNINSQNNTANSIEIGNEWLGTGSKILAGVTIEDAMIIAAGAIVKNDVKANQIIGGIPAKVIGEKSEKCWGCYSCRYNKDYLEKS